MSNKVFTCVYKTYIDIKKEDFRNIKVLKLAAIKNRSLLL